MQARTSQEILVELQASDPHVGRPCTHCGDALESGQSVIICPRCKSVHHTDCWHANAGCAKRGCPQLASSVDDREAPTRYEPPQPRRLNTWVIVALVFAFLAAAGMGIYRQITAEQPLMLMVPEGPDYEQLEAITQAYTASQNGELRVNVVTVPSGRLFIEKLVIMLAARRPPDVFALPLEMYRQYVAEGALLPLREADVKGLNLDPKRMKNVEVDGTFYGLPHPSLPHILMVPVSTRYPDEARALLRYVVQHLPPATGVDDSRPLPIWSTGPPINFSPIPGY